MKYFTSDLSGKKYPINEKIQLSFIRNSVLNFIKIDHPEMDDTKSISLEELDNYRQRYIEYSLKKEFEDLNTLQSEVISKIRDKDLISIDTDESYSEELSISQKVADKVATFGGSWKFIISFLVIIVVWIIFNTYGILFKAFDPFPFILLNLFLSCLAAFQAPVIMMSQNRQEEKDRKRSKDDYKVNLKSELELQILQEKIDHLILIQQQKLFEIQNIQIDMLKEISDDLSILKTAIKEKK